MNYTEFKLSVPIYDLDNETADGDSSELKLLFECLNADGPGCSLGKKYHSYSSNVVIPGGLNPSGTTGKGIGNVVMLLSQNDERSFVVIDMCLDPTDQMNIVLLGVRCDQAEATKVSAILRSIRERAEVAGPLLQGNLGLEEQYSFANFPRRVGSNSEQSLQQIEIYRGGVLVQMSK